MRTACAIIVACALGASSAVRADEPAGSAPWSPPVCTSYDPSRGQYGVFGAWDPISTEFCPDGSAYIAEVAVNGIESRNIPISPIGGNCCALPPDAFVGVHHFVAGQCPDGFVVTGVRGMHITSMEVVQDGPGTYFLRCSLLNLDRYQLGPEVLAFRITTVPLGFSRSGVLALLGYFPHVTTAWARIPAGIRYAIGRINRFGYEDTFCAGFPWGSLLVGRKENSACGFTHRELQYRGADGDPPQGTPVPMFPECDAIEDQYGPRPRCIRGNRERATGHTSIRSREISARRG